MLGSQSGHWHEVSPFSLNPREIRLLVHGELPCASAKKNNRLHCFGVFCTDKIIKVTLPKTNITCPLKAMMGLEDDPASFWGPVYNFFRGKLAVKTSREYIKIIKRQEVNKKMMKVLRSSDRHFGTETEQPA